MKARNLKPLNPGENMPEPNYDDLAIDLDRLLDMGILDTWEHDFCADILDLIEQGRTLTDNQLDRCQTIVNEH